MANLATNLIAGILFSLENQKNLQLRNLLVSQLQYYNTLLTSPYCTSVFIVEFLIH